MFDAQSTYFKVRSQNTQNGLPLSEVYLVADVGKPGVENLLNGFDKVVPSD